VTKRKILLTLAAAGLVVTVVAGREKPALEVVRPAAPRADARIELDLSKLERPVDEGVEKDLFATRSFSEQQKASSGKPEKPTAPALPFAYIGKVIEDGKLTVFLSRGGESYSVAPGDTIGPDYRVDAVSDAEIPFTYLPLKTKQKLPL
jgi:hypothetical protein